jgi:hypothetical protein
MSKPNCYECKWRGSVPGSAHSCCKHPKNGWALDDPMLQILSVFASVGRVDPIQAETGLHVKGDPGGVAHGWFNWPFDFDPTWLEECDGFTAVPSI